MYIVHRASVTYYEFILSLAGLWKPPVFNRTIVTIQSTERERKILLLRSRLTRVIPYLFFRLCLQPGDAAVQNSYTLSFRTVRHVIADYFCTQVAVKKLKAFWKLKQVIYDDESRMNELTGPDVTGNCLLLLYLNFGAVPLVIALQSLLDILSFAKETLISIYVIEDSWVCP